MKRGGWWPIGITAVLAMTVAANVWVATVASDDPSFAIEPDYYKKAVAWDSTLAQARTNAMLGWHLTPTLGPIRADGAELRAILTDSSGAAISNANVKVSALQVSRASDVHRLALAATDGGGSYLGKIDARLPGQWELRFDVTLGSTHFTDVARVEAR